MFIELCMISKLVMHLNSCSMDFGWDKGPHPCTPFIFQPFAWAAFPGYGNVCYTFYVPCWAKPLERWQCLVYFPASCVSIVHDACICVYIYIYTYICLCVRGWLFPLYDGFSWLCERPSLVMRTLNLVVWAWAQDNCCRCIFMLYCVHDHRSVIVLIHVTKWHWFPRVCDMY